MFYVREFLSNPLSNILLAESAKSKTEYSEESIAKEQSFCSSYLL